MKIYLLNLFCLLGIAGAKGADNYILGEYEIEKPGQPVAEWKVSKESLDSLKPSWPILDNINIEQIVKNAQAVVANPNYSRFAILPPPSIDEKAADARANLLKNARYRFISICFKEIGWTRIKGDLAMVHQQTGRAYAEVTFISDVSYLVGTVTIYILTDGTAIEKVEREASEDDLERLKLRMELINSAN